MNEKTLGKLIESFWNELLGEIMANNECTAEYVVMNGDRGFVIACKDEALKVKQDWESIGHYVEVAKVL